MFEPSVSREFTQAVFDYLALAGHSDQAVLRTAGLDATRLLPSGRVPLTTYERLFQAGETLTGDDCFGLNMGASPHPKNWGLVSHLAVSAPDALTAASALMDYSELQLNFVRFNVLESSQDSLCMALQHDGVDHLNRHVAEHLLANITVLATTLVGYRLPELRIAMAHDNAHSAQELSRMLSAVVTINAGCYQVEAGSQFLEQRSLYGGEDLFRVTGALARERLMELRGEDRFLNKVRETVLQQLPGGLPKVNDVAGILQVSARTLQRRLQERNLRYQQVLDEVRGELALQLIRDTSLSLNDMAHYLGFNDQSALQHAFRRWHGTTPGRYRKHASSAGLR